MSLFKSIGTTALKNKIKRIEILNYIFSNNKMIDFDLPKKQVYKNVPKIHLINLLTLTKK